MLESDDRNFFQFGLVVFGLCGFLAAGLDWKKNQTLNPSLCLGG